MSFPIFNKVTKKQNPNLTELPETNDSFKGIDLFAAKTWIYPTNKPRRDYQFDILTTALHHNTMVSLPTGLGKTLIAAILMYNMYRWYPGYKVIFMAPTRPLVAQQAKACREITCIPKDHTIQLTGDVLNTTRGPIWEKHSVFFITPQILVRDLETKICPVTSIRCLVFDEAHRARGDYAYCQVMRLLGEHIKNVRVLALSATPGATAAQVAEVLRALNISKLEVRTENSPDVKPYVFNKILERVVVPLGTYLSDVKDKYILILDQYTRRLMQAKILTGSAANIHKGRIFMAQKQYKERCQQSGQRPCNYLMQDLTFCLTLYHGYELLQKHGLRVFLFFFEEHGGDKAWVHKNEQLSELLTDVRNYLGAVIIDTNLMPDGTIPPIPAHIKFGHPKYYKTREVVEKHFKEQPDTRVMIFCEYVDSVNEIFAALLTARPLIRPKVFLGQSAMSQKKQLETMQKFRTGTECNTIICTCVAEEGLDVAAVQLIVCFDIANRSPIRLAQRMGRTGRHQIGRIVILVTEGREEQMLKETLEQSSILDERLLKTPLVRDSLRPDGPAMIPPHINSVCQELHMTDVVKPTDEISPKRKRTSRKHLEDLEMDDWDGSVPTSNRISLNIENFWANSNSLDDVSTKRKRLKKFKNNIHHKILFGPSSNTNLLRQLLKTSDDLKLNLPITKTEITIQKTRNRDIRQMFSKATQDDFIIPNSIESTRSTQSSRESWKSSGFNSRFMLNLMSEVNARNSYELIRDKACTMCRLCECEHIRDLIKPHVTVLPEFQVPEECDFNGIEFEAPPQNLGFDFERFNNERKFNKLRDVHNISTRSFMNDSLNPVLTLNPPEEFLSHTVFNDMFDDPFDDYQEIHSKRVEVSSDTQDYPEGPKLETLQESSPKTTKIAPVFVTPMRKPKKAKKIELTPYIPDKQSKEALDFFGLDSLDDIFEEPKTSCDVSPIICTPKASKDTMPYPNLSPILCTPKPVENTQNTNLDYTSDDELFTDEDFNYNNSEQELTNNQEKSFPKSECSENVHTEPCKEVNKLKDFNYPTSEQQLTDNQDKIFPKTECAVSVPPEPCKEVYSSDEDLFPDDSINDDLFTDVTFNSSLKENMNSSRREIVKSPILSQGVRSQFFRNTKSPLGNSTIINSISGKNCSKLDIPQRVSTQSENTNSVNGVTQTETNRTKKNMFQLKRNLDVVSDVDSVDSDDISMLDFVTPMKKKFKLDMLKKKANSVQNGRNSPILISSDSGEDDVMIPSQFLLEDKKKVTGSTQNEVNPEPKLNSKVTPHKKKLNLSILRDRVNSPKSIPKSSPTRINQHSSKSVLKSPPLKIRENTFVRQNRSSPLNSPKSSRSSPLSPVKSEDDVLNLSQFTFQSHKKVLGSSNNETKIGYHEYKMKNPEPKVPKVKRVKRKNEFIDEEAEVSSDEDVSSDEKCDSDEFDASFVEDEEVLTQADVDMKAHYLRSIKSPQGGKFKIPALPAIKRRHDIFSQVPADASDDEYTFDTFCVNDTIEEDPQLSFLEIVEMKLAEQRKKRKKGKEVKSRIRTISTDSSSDEEEQMAKLREELMQNQSVIR